MKRYGKVIAPLIVAVAAVVVLVGCGSGGGLYGGGAPKTKSTPAATTAGAGGGTGAGGVAIQNFAFSPQTLTVKAGATVTWTNMDSTSHTVTSTNGPSAGAATTSLFDSGLLSQGGRFSFTFKKAGTYHYECTIHKSMPSMHGTVIVK